MRNSIVLGTRSSALALAQTALTKDALLRAHPALGIEVKPFTTRGDRKLDLSLLKADEAGGKGLFTKELEEALLAGGIDVAIHSLKDLPAHNPPGLEVCAVLERAASGDMLISKAPRGVDGLETGARVGTSSVRRAHQLRWLRPDLEIQEWRGNVQTRLRKLIESPIVSGIVLAEAGLERLGFSLSDGTIAFEGTDLYAASLADCMLPAIGQGVIALQTRKADMDTAALLGAIHHEQTFLTVRAERELQRLLEGDCTLPIGVRCTTDGSRLFLRAVLFSPGGGAPSEASADGPISNPEAVAAHAFAQLNTQSNHP